LAVLVEHAIRQSDPRAAAPTYDVVLNSELTGVSDNDNVTVTGV